MKGNNDTMTVKPATVALIVTTVVVIPLAIVTTVCCWKRWKRKRRCNQRQTNINKDQENKENEPLNGDLNTIDPPNKAEELQMKML